MKPSLVITDTYSKVLYASPECTSRAGFDIPEIIGKTPGQTWGGLMPAVYYKRLWDKINRKRPYMGRVENKKKNGEKFLDHIHVVGIPDQEGNIRYFLELHPGSDAVEYIHEFERQLKKYSDRSHNPNDIANILESWVGIKIGKLFTTRNEFIGYLEEEFILKTEEKYAARKNDRALILEAKKSPDVFASLYHKYFMQVRMFFLHRVRNEALAEDLSQEVFARAFKSLKEYRPSNASYLTYLLRIAHNLLVSHYRKGNHIVQFMNRSVDLREELERHDAMSRALNLISRTDRQIILMKYQEGLRIKEIAKRLGSTENAIKLKLSRARKKLRNKIRG